MFASIVFSFLVFTLPVVHGREPPSVCMLSPLATINAGETIHADVINPQGRPCGATLIFSDPNFLPVTFDLQPTLCLGYQRAEVLIPIESPNGEVTILWECAGDSGQSCTRALIEKGTADVEALDRQQAGRINCVVPTATVATLVTSVQGPSTFTGTVLTTLFSTNAPPTLATEAKADSSGIPGGAEASRTGDSASTPVVIDLAATGTEATEWGPTSATGVSTLVMVISTPTPKIEASALVVSADVTSAPWSEGYSICPCDSTPTKSV